MVPIGLTFSLAGCLCFDLSSRILTLPGHHIKKRGRVDFPRHCDIKNINFSLLFAEDKEAVLKFSPAFNTISQVGFKPKHSFRGEG